MDVVGAQRLAALDIGQAGAKAVDQLAISHQRSRHAGQPLLVDLGLQHGMGRAEVEADHARQSPLGSQLARPSVRSLSRWARSDRKAIACSALGVSA